MYIISCENYKNSVRLTIDICASPWLKYCGARWEPNISIPKFLDQDIL